ncbi:MAG TPA: chemotaxis protein CheB [Candidatus Limnocylindrales bacterium]
MAQRQRVVSPDRLIVLAASAGGVEALSAVARGLPAGLPAGIVAVLHVPNDATSHMPEILSRAGALPALHASDGATLTPAEFVVAPPDRHVIVSAGRLWLNDGPRENGVRPAADPLFRSAARSYGERAIGVVLSGTLDDGAAGLATIAAAGGMTIVQDPRDAAAPGMPRAALETARVDHVVPADEIGPLLATLVATQPTRPEHAGPSEAAERDLGPTDVGCPACGGVLRNVEDSGVTRFRCRVGHSYSPETLIAAQDRALEEALWAALRGLEDQASTAERVAGTMRDRGLGRVAARFEERRAQATARASVVRNAIDEVGISRAVEPEGRREADEIEEAEAAS